MASLGWPRTKANPQVLLVLGLLGAETTLSLAKNP
jgi:hypothetical protein